MTLRKRIERLQAEQKRCDDERLASWDRFVASLTEEARADLDRRLQSGELERMGRAEVLAYFERLSDMTPPVWEGQHWALIRPVLDMAPVKLPWQIQWEEWSGAILLKCYGELSPGIDAVRAVYPDVAVELKA